METHAWIPGTATVVDRWLDGSLLFPIAAKHLARTTLTPAWIVRASRILLVSCWRPFPHFLFLSSPFYLVARVHRRPFSLFPSRVRSLRARRFTLRAPRSVRKFYDSLVRTHQSRGRIGLGESRTLFVVPMCDIASTVCLLRIDIGMYFGWCAWMN